MAKKLNIFLSFLISIIIAFSCGVYFSEDLGYSRSEPTIVKAGQTVADDDKQTVDAENEPSNGDGEKGATISTAQNQGGNETANDEPEATRVTAKNRFSDPREFRYSVNSANGITLTWLVDNLTGKTINYYTVKVSTFNPVGDPSYDEHSGKNSFNLQYVGPVIPGLELGVFELFTYQGALDSIRIDEVDLEYADGTKETVVYNRTTKDDSGLNNR
ncbi:hypothetical protein [Paenibacillus glucanolyticus]|uniref:hypothetical protein n=1 Tax=Paenibacillus glucanolyticus TaxID=59843 RepID=UPI0033843FA5